MVRKRKREYRKVLGRKRLFETSAKTTTPQGRRQYMAQYMKAYRDLTRKRRYSPRRRKK